jgi:hypothetical protein
VLEDELLQEQEGALVEHMLAHLLGVVGARKVAPSQHHPSAPAKEKHKMTECKHPRTRLCKAYLSTCYPGVGVCIGSVAVRAHVVLHHKVDHKCLLEDSSIEHLCLQAPPAAGISSNNTGWASTASGPRPACLITEYAINHHVL